MWLVRIALRRPYTFVVMAMLIVLFGVLSIRTMPTDILPEIEIPVVAVVWTYGGLPPEEMEKRLIGGFERLLTTQVNDIEHIESQSLTGVAVIKVFFHPGAKIEAAVAQISASSQGTLRSLPGAMPPMILRYSASNAPVLQLVLESEKLSEQQLFDLATNFVRAGVSMLKGVGVPNPYGGKARQVMVDIDVARLYGFGLSPRDVINALSVQNLTLPTGTIKMGPREYPVLINSSPDSLTDLSEIPIRTPRGETVLLRDVASLRDGFAPQTSLVHANGKRAAVMPILKSQGASTLDVVARVREALPGLLSTLPPELKIAPIFDQSLFVRAAVSGVVHEAVIAASLTALMMLLFLGSLRSTLIVVVSIPLSILVAISILGLLGHSLNMMTLGGMALAVGILVDDATVELENIHRNLAQGKPLLRAILDGAQEIAAPAFVSTLCICIVFVPIAFITGPARSLFVPLALSVVLAMLTSYFLSRTLVPTLVRYLLAGELAAHEQGGSRAPSALARLQQRFEALFERLRLAYGRALDRLLAHARISAALLLGFSLLSFALFWFTGSDFFPSVDAGLIRLHVRAPPGTRIEESERLFEAVEATIKDAVPASEIDNLLFNIGVTNSPINLSMSDGTMISAADGEIMIALERDHRPTGAYVRELRKRLSSAHPESTFFFLAPDISTQVLNFGGSAPIDVRVVGPAANAVENLRIARKLERALHGIAGIVDVRLHQVTATPQIRVAVDRDAASQLGLSQRDVASDLLIALSSSGQTAPNFWLDPRRGIQYAVAVQTPQYRMDSMDSLGAIPIGSGGPRAPQLLGNLASFSRGAGATNITHYNAMPSYDVLASVEDSDLGSVAAKLERLVAEFEKTLPRGSRIELKGQIESMDASFRGLGYGLIFAVLLVYLLMVVNFQSWLDPFVILMALPAAIAGIGWLLFMTGTPLSVPALTGAIMCVGVATANSILVVTFANDQRRGHASSAREAAWLAGSTRLRPVLMTAFAMIVGMLPTSLGLSEGGEQNAPLGRAVVGGLSLATLATLFLVPIIYSLLRQRAPSDFSIEEPT
jgi:multidrug efflux pump subunit AcrB